MNTPDDVVCDHDECEGRFCNLEVEALYDERDALIVETQELRARLAATPIPPVPAGAPGLSREDLVNVVRALRAVAPLMVGEEKWNALADRFEAAARTGDQESGEATKP